MAELGNVQQLKAMLQRLGAGEDLASVREDFVKSFKDVPVKDIMAAEQELINGADPRKITKLCDLHSALFHGKTEGEVIREQKRMKKQDLLQLPEGHPVDYFIRENSALELILNNLQMALENGGHDDKVQLAMVRLKKIRALYGKKEELIMAPLERYGITGPSEVMWGVDDEIKAEVGRLARGLQRTSAEELKEPILAVIKRMREMIYKDENILLPIAMQNLTDDEWVDVYRDLPEMGPVFITEIPKWAHGEQVLMERMQAEKSAAEAEDMKTPASGADFEQAVVHFDGNGSESPAGEMTIAQLRGLMKILPLDITFIDDQMINRFYKNGDKVFSRPLSTLGQSTYQCHPVPIRAVVKNLTDDFRSGARDSFTRWIPNPDRPVKVTYLAVRDKEGTYLGAAEVIQDMTEAFRQFRSMEAASMKAEALKAARTQPGQP
jgi:DUF438 domain-containing protein